MMSREDKRWM